MNASFAFASTRLDPQSETLKVADPASGGFVSFEGWVRDENDGERVRGLEYEAYVALAEREGARIVAEALARFGVRQVRCVHRVGSLAIGELAVWVGVSATHRAEAFAACRYVIDEVKHRVPIWKKEYYVSGDSGWVNCERCAQPGLSHASDHAHQHDHGHPHVQATADGTRVLPASDYSRQMRLREVGVAGQARLRAARVLVIGAGGLGVPVLSYLAGAGVGVLGIVDADTLAPSNLHRQTLYSLHDVGQPKALLAARHLRALNPDVDVRPFVARAASETLRAWLADYDVVVDCADNFATTFTIHDEARRLGVAAVLASIYQYEGQLQVVRGNGEGSCLRCVWDAATPDGAVGNCAEAGVLGPVPGVLGSLQAMETLKLLLNLPGRLEDELLLVDLLSLQTRRLKAPRHAACTGRCTRLPPARDNHDDLDRAFASLAQLQASGLALIDIREADEVARLPVPNAAHIPMARLIDDPSLADGSRDTLLLCARGARSRATAELLRARGHARVWSLLGGIDALPAPEVATN